MLKQIAALLGPLELVALALFVGTVLIWTASAAIVLTR